MTKWEANLSEAERRKAGLTDEQKRARFARQAAVLARLELGGSPEAKMLRNASK